MVFNKNGLLKKQIMQIKIIKKFSFKDIGLTETTGIKIMDQSFSIYAEKEYAILHQ